MIIGIGIDILDHSQLQSLDLDSDPFFTYTFSDAERQEASKNDNPLRYFAGRFCVKEAAIKAFNGFAERADMHDIETLTGKDGIPEIHMKGSLANALPEAIRIHVSISHESHTSIALVIGEIPD